MTHPSYTHICVLIVLIPLPNEGQTAGLKIDPHEITIGGQNPTPTLNITCTPSASGITSVIKLEIGKKTSKDVNQAIVEIFRGMSNIVTVDPSLNDRMEATGSIQEVSGRLQIVLSQLQSSDAATYVCKTSYLVGTDIQNDEIDDTVTLRKTTDAVTATGSKETKTETGKVKGTTEAGTSAGTTSLSWIVLLLLLLVIPRLG